MKLRDQNEDQNEAQDEYQWLLEKDERGQTPFHRIFARRDLLPLLKNLATPEMLSIKDNYGNTPVHYMALSDLIEELPERFYTLNIFHEKGEENRTVLHNLAIKDQFYLAPKSVLTPAVFQEVDTEESNILHYLAWNNSLDEVPKDLMTEAALTQINIHGASPMDILVEKAIEDEKVGYPFDQSKRLETALDILGLKSLQSLKRKVRFVLIKDEINKRISKLIPQELSKRGGVLEIS
jgi:hypothetical protein